MTTSVAPADLGGAVPGCIADAGGGSRNVGAGRLLQASNQPECLQRLTAGKVPAGVCYAGEAPHPTRPDPTRPDPTRPDPTRPDPTRPDPTRLSRTGARSLRLRRTSSRFLPRTSRALRTSAHLFGACLAALPAGAAAESATPRLLTGLTAEAGPKGVVLAWTVDESRAGRIAGFSCAYLSPAHLRLGLTDTVPCGAEDSPPEARRRTVAGLPEYGEYLFEFVAQTNAGPGIPWTERALHARVAVTEALTGPPGPARAVTGAGPLVRGCGPDGAGEPWRLDEIVSAAHLTHYPGQGWRPGGDPSAAPEWPEPTPIATLIRDAGIELAAVREALSDAGGAAARALGESGFMAAAARAGATTKALLRRGADGAHELKLHSGYPFGATYRYGAGHVVPGWNDADRPALRPALWNRTDCPPPGAPGANHDVALALSRDAGEGRRLARSGYGWWTVAPVGLHPGRIVAAKAGLSFGAPAPEQPAAGAVWRGRAAGHLFLHRRRWAVAADATLILEGAPPRLAGRLDNVELAPLDARSLRPAPGAPASLPPLVLRAAADGEAPAPPTGWSGAVRVAAEPAAGLLAGLPAADAFMGDWLAAAHGPGAAEAAGRLRLWTPLPADADPAADWPAQAVLVAGFGALRE